MKNKILLGIDVEEFDLPEEYGQEITEELKLNITLKGLGILNKILDNHQIRVTFFTTAYWASHFPNMIKEFSQKHEIASHTFYHSSFKLEDLHLSRKKLQEISGQEIYGVRMPRMKTVDLKIINSAGYVYDSSLHPTWIPGRYNNLKKKRKIFKSENIYEIPISVTPILRIPVFWLAFKNFNFSFYKYLCKQILAKNGYLVLYFHPWEFTELSSFKLPKMIRRLDGNAMTDRMNKLIEFLKNLGEFQTHVDFINSQLTE